MTTTSLLEHMQEADGEYFPCLQELTLPLTKEQQQTLGRMYSSLENISGLYNVYNAETFALYQEAGSLDTALFEEYTTLVNQFRTPTCQLVYQGNWLQKRTQKTMAKNHKDAEGIIVTMSGGGSAVILGVLGGIVLGPPGAAIGMLYGGFGGFFAGAAYLDACKNKRVTYSFGEQKAEDILLTTHRLHYVAQKFSRKITDISCSDAATADALIANHGMGTIFKKIEAAKTEVQRVIDYTGTILDALKITRPVTQQEHFAEQHDDPSDDNLTNDLPEVKEMVKKTF